jgi:SAM-dependent methyltransferase
VNVNNEFYLKNAESFARTRMTPWTGWAQGMRAICEDMHNQECAPSPFHVLDIAAGNLRFEQFMREEHANLNAHFTAVDYSQELFDSSEFRGDDIRFIKKNVTGRLINEQKLQLPDAALVCCFGFFHHIPGFLNRLRFCQELAELTRRRGYLFLSFWSFANTEQEQIKARKFTTEFTIRPELSTEYCGNIVQDLESDDYFLSWKNNGTYRYCHNFTREEIDKIRSTLEEYGQFTLIKEYAADGKLRTFNSYLIMRRS